MIYFCTPNLTSQLSGEVTSDTQHGHIRKSKHSSCLVRRNGLKREIIIYVYLLYD